MITLANLETQVAHLNAEAFADGILRDAEYLPPEGRDEMVRLARAPSREHAMQIAGSLWGGQWRHFFRKLDRQGSGKIHFYDRTRENVPFTVRNFGKGEIRDPKTLSFDEQVIEVGFPYDPKPLLRNLAALINLANSINQDITTNNIHEPIYFTKENTKEEQNHYLRIESLDRFLERVRTSSEDSPLEPVLIYGLISPLERAILFVLGKFPLSFSLVSCRIHSESCHPIIVPFHDLFHLASSAHDGDTVRTIIYSALATFDSETLARPGLAKALDYATELALNRMVLFRRIFDAAKKVGASEDEINHFVKMVTLLFSQPVLNPFEGIRNEDSQTCRKILAHLLKGLLKNAIEDAIAEQKAREESYRNNFI